MSEFCKRILYPLFNACKDIYNKNYLTNASSLAYSTLLSIIPLLSVFIYIASYSEFFQKFNLMAKNYMLDNMMPSSNSKIIYYLDTLSQQANQAPTVSIIFLLFTALWLIMAIDNAMNIVWKNKTRRKNLLYFFIYLASIFLLPLAIAFASITSSVVSSILDNYPNLNYLQYAIRLIINALLLCCFYLITASRSIHFYAAFYGGVITSLLLDFLRYIFKIYITQYSNYESIYGALSVIPVFLIWIFIIWSTVIYGALVAKNYMREFTRNGTL